MASSSNSGSPAYALASHVINQTLTSIATLESLNLLSPADAHLIRSKLPPASGPHPALDPAQRQSVSFLPSSFSTLNVSNVTPSPHDYRSPQSPIPASQSQQFNQPPPSPYQPPALPPRVRAPESRGRALWDYNGTEHDDLTFRSGDTLIIDEEVNDQWYRGRVIPQGQMDPLDRTGLFPSNYIEKLPHQGQYTSPPPLPSQMVPYQPPGPVQQYGYDRQPQQMMLPPPPQHMMSQPPPGQVSYPVQEQHKNNRFGKVGGKIGTAFVTGAGFGAGSAIASEAVHAIF